MNFLFSDDASLESIHAVILSDTHFILDHARDYSRAVDALQALEQILAEYFAYQDDAFYDALASAEKTRSKMVEFLRHDIRDLKIDCITFMDTYTRDANLIRVRNFPKDFLALSKRIYERLMTEREYLLPLLPRKK